MMTDRKLLHRDVVSIGEAADAMVRDAFIRRFERALDDASRALFEGHGAEARAHLDEAKRLLDREAAHDAV